MDEGPVCFWGRICVTEANLPFLEDLSAPRHFLSPQQTILRKDFRLVLLGLYTIDGNPGLPSELVWVSLQLHCADAKAQKVGKQLGSPKS